MHRCFFAVRENPEGRRIIALVPSPPCAGSLASLRLHSIYSPNAAVLSPIEGHC